jgi:hypothetical protein
VALSFLTPELAKWDSLSDGPELLFATFFSDERPLRGTTGLLDWRLCGRLSRLALAGKITGALGETTLLPAQRLAFQKLVLFGLGPSESFDEARFREAARAIKKVAKNLSASRFALGLPGRSTGRIMARRALELWVEECGTENDVWLIEPQAAQKDMSDALGKRRA